MKGGRPDRRSHPLAVAAVWLLFLAPIAVLPGLYNRWIWPTLLCVAAAAICAVWVTATGRLPWSVWIPVLGLVTALMLSAVLGAAPIAQLLGRAPRYEGLVTFPVYAAAAWAGARVVGPRAGLDVIRHVVRATAVAAALLAFVALLESVGLRPIESDLARPGSLAGNATDQGILGVIFLAVLGSVAVGAWRRTREVAYWALGGALAGSVAIATSASRAAALAGAVVVAALVVRWIATSGRRVRDGLIAACVIVVLGGAGLLIPLTRERLLGESPLADQTIADRVLMWEDAWALFLQRPVLGVGPNGFSDAITTRFGDEWFTRAGTGAILDSPHNIVLQSLTVGGIVGFGLACALAGVVIWRGVRAVGEAVGPRRDLRVGAMLATLAAAVALLTHVTSPVTLVPLATLVGLLVAAPPDRTRRPIARWLATALGAVWIGGLAVATVADAALLAGQTAVVRGDLVEGESAFATAQALRPWDPDIALVAAESLGSAAESGSPEAGAAAAAWSRAAVSWLPASSRAHYVAGMVAAIGGDYPSARDDLVVAADISPADPRIRLQLGRVALRAGDLSTARAELMRAGELAPAWDETWRELEVVCNRLGDAGCARSARLHLED